MSTDKVSAPDSAEPRRYRMTRRAELVESTRQRIVDAAVELHGTLGPAFTSLAAIAELAGVTRATLYRHFPDEVALHAACSSHWMSRQQLPDPDAWERVEDPRERLTTGLADLYRFFHAGAQMLTAVHRDLEAVAEPVRCSMAEEDRRRRDALLAGLPGAEDPVVRALTGHAVSFGTWRSLCVDQGLTDDEAVAAMAGTVLAALDRSAARRPGPVGQDGSTPVPVAGR